MAEEKGASDLNLVERDPKGLNDSVQVGGQGKYSPYRHAEKLQQSQQFLFFCFEFEQYKKINRTNGGSIGYLDLCPVSTAAVCIHSIYLRPTAAKQIELRKI